MVRVISQETFDAVVKENVEELEMSLEDAVKDAKEQFVAQGVNLDNIVIPGEDGLKHPVISAIKSLQELFKEPKESWNSEDICQNCDIVFKECDKGISERVLATKHEGYTTLVQCAQEASDGEEKVQIASVKALTSLMDGNPDPLEEQGYKLLISCLSSSNDDLIQETLNWCLNCCVRHEDNRQNFVRNNLLVVLDNVSDKYPLEVARIWQALVQDDDIRVPFGQAHEHARMIVEDHNALGKLTKAIQETSQESELILYLSCLSSLTVRNEYCQAVVDQGGLKCLLDLLSQSNQSANIVKESLRLLKTLAGNDNVKREVNIANGVPLIVSSISNNINNKAVCGIGCGTLTAITLRNPDNAKQVMDAGGAQLLTQVLKVHIEVPAVANHCCNAIRNIVSRAKDLAKKFIDEDVEPLLNEVKKRHPKCQDAAKAALRDLGLKVELTEQWKGGAVKNE